MTLRFVVPMSLCLCLVLALPASSQQSSGEDYDPPTPPPAADDAYDPTRPGGEDESYNPPRPGGDDAADGVEASVDPELMSELMAEGEPLFTDTCASCHAADGGGQVGPPLRRNVSFTDSAIRAVVRGRGTMPPVAADMDHREIAAILTYVRSSFGNDFGAVTEDDVAAALQDE